MAEDWSVRVGVEPHIEPKKLQTQIDNSTKNIKIKVDVSPNDKASVNISNITKQYKQLSNTTDKLNVDFKQMNTLYSELGKSNSADKLTSDYKELNKVMGSVYSQIKVLKNEQSSKLFDFNLDAKYSQLQSKIDTFTNANPKAISKMGASFTDLKTRVESASKSADATEYKKLNTTFSSLTKQTEALGLTGDTVFSKLAKNAKLLFYYLGSATVVMTGVNAIRSMIAEVANLDKSIVDLQQATGFSNEETKKLLNTYIEMGKQLGATGVEVANAASSWLKQGKSIADTNTLIKDSMILSKVGSIESADATKYLTTITKSYGIATQDTLSVVDKLSKVDLISATDVGGLAQSLNEVSSNAQSLGVNLDEVLGYVAAIGETSGEQMSAVGNSLNTMFSRMANIKLKRLVDPTTGEDLSNTETSLRRVGIELRSDNETFRDFSDVLTEVASNWSGYNDVTKQSIAASIAGVDHINDFKILMQQFGKATEYTNASLNSSGSAMVKFSAYEDGVEAKTKKMQASFQELASDTLDSQVIKSFLDVSNVLINITDDVGLFNIALVALAGVIGAKTTLGATAFAESLTVMITDMGVATGTAETLGMALSTAIPVFGAIAAITLISKGLDELITTTKELDEAVASAGSAYESAKSNLESINTELESQTKLMDSLLAKDNLTFIEKDQLEDLKAATQELQIQKDLAEDAENLAQKNLAVSSANDANKKYKVNDITTSNIGKYQIDYEKNSEVSGNIGDLTTLTNDKNDIASLIAGYKELVKIKDQALNSGNTDVYQTYLDKSEEINDSIKASTSALEEQKANMKDYYNVIKSIPYEEMTTDQKKVFDSYNNISNAIETVYKELDPNKWKDMQITSFMSTDSGKKTIEELKEMAKINPVTAENINSSKEYSKLLSDTGLSANEAAEQINAMASSTDSSSTSMDSASKSTKEVVTSMYSLAEASASATGFVNDLGEDVDISKLQNSIDSAQSAVEDYKSILKDMDDNNGLTINGLEIITQKYPQYLSYIGDEQELRKQLQQGITDQKKTTEDYYKDILELDTNLYNTVLNNNSDLVNELNSYYGIDLSNYKSLAQSKYQTDTTLLSQLKQKWADFYKTQAAATSIQSAATTSTTTFDNMGLYLGDGGMGDKAIADANKKAQEAKAAAEKESAMYKKIQNLFKDTDYTGLNLDGISTAGKNAGGSKKSGSGSESKFSAQIDWASQKTKDLESDITQLNKTLANTSTLDGQKNVYQQLIDKQTELSEAYKNTSNSYNDQYTNALKNKNLTSADINNIKNGSYKTESFNGKGDNSIEEKRYNAIQKAIDLRDKLSSANSNVSDAVSNLKDYATKLADIPWDNATKKVDSLNSDIDLLNERLNNTTDFTERNKILDQILSKQKQIIDKYSNAVKDNQTNVDSLYGQINKKDRVGTNGKAVKSGTEISTKGITIGSDEYTTIILYNKAVKELKTNTTSLALEQEKYKGEVADTKSQKFDNINSIVDKTLSKYDDLNSEVGSSLNFVDDNSLEQIALYQTGLQNSKDKVSALNTEISKLKKSYNSGAVSETDYKERLSDLTSQLNDASSSAKNYYDEIVEAMKNRYNEEIDTLESTLEKELDALEKAHDKKIDDLDDELDAYKKIVDAKKESLDADKEARDYQKDIADKTKNIADIQSRMTELQQAANSGDREANKELSNLQDDLSKAQQDLDDTQYGHKKDLEENALDKSYEDYEDLVNGKIDLENSLYDQQKNNLQSEFDTKKSNIDTLFTHESELIKQAADLTGSQFSTVFANINKQLSEYGLSMSSGLSGALSTTNNGTSPASSGVSIGASVGTSSPIETLLKNGSGTQGDSELNKYVHDKYSKYLTYSEMAQLGSMLGVSGIGNATDMSNGTNRSKVLAALKKAGFSSGGYVDASGTGSLVKQITGEDGIALVKHGEPILTVEQGKLFKDLIKNIQPLNNLVKFSTPNLSNISTVNNSSPTIQINLPPSTTIDNSAINNYRKLIPELTNAVSEQLMNISRQYKQ